VRNLECIDIKRFLPVVEMTAAAFFRLSQEALYIEGKKRSRYSKTRLAHMSVTDILPESQDFLRKCDAARDMKDAPQSPLDVL
jgi:hypothetical protein